MSNKEVEYKLSKYCARAKYISLPERKKQMKKTKSYVSSSERKEIITTLGLSSFVLLDYYYQCSGRNNLEQTDKRASIAIGMTIRQVADARRKLIKAGWYKVTKQGELTVYHIGKQSVCNEYDEALRSLGEEELSTYLSIIFRHTGLDHPSQLHHYDLVPWIDEII